MTYNRTRTAKHVRLHVAHHTTYLTDPETPPRVPSHRHTTAVSASTAERARRTPSNMDASFSTGSFLFHKTMMFSFASWSCSIVRVVFRSLADPKSACRQYRQEDSQEGYTCTPDVWESLLSACQLCNHAVPGGIGLVFKAPLSRLALDSRGDGAELIWEERSLVHAALYTAVGEVRGYWEDSGGQAMVNVAGGCRDIGAPALIDRFLRVPPLCWPPDPLSHVARMCFDIGLKVLTYGF